MIFLAVAVGHKVQKKVDDRLVNKKVAHTVLRSDIEVTSSMFACKHRHTPIKNKMPLSQPLSSLYIPAHACNSKK